VQQVDHRPQVTAFLDVDLEQAAQVVERRAAVPEHALLLDRRGLGVALRDDQAAQAIAELAGHLAPAALADVVAEVDLAILGTVGEEDAPPVVGHLHVVEVRPAALADADRRAQVDLVLVEVGRAERLPTTSRNFGCHFSSAIIRRLLSRRPTLLGILASRSTLMGAHVLLQSNLALRACAVAGQSAFVAGGVRAREDPVLPRAEAAEDLAVAGLGAAEAQARLHAGEGIGRQRRALFERDAHVVVPVDRVEQVGDEALFVGVGGPARPLRRRASGRVPAARGSGSAGA
jgi:hypothetical protein